MTERRHVWTMLFGEVTIYQENENGTLASSTPIAHACYLEGLSLSEILETSRREVYGRSSRKITTRTFEYEANFEALHISKRTEYTAIKSLGRNAFLRLVINFEDDSYDGIAPFDNDEYALTKCRRTKFEITGSDTNVIIASATFLSEGIL